MIISIYNSKLKYAIHGANQLLERGIGMVLRWIVVGEIEGKSVTDTVVTFLDNVFVSNEILSTAYTKINGKLINALGYDVEVKHVLEIAANRHVNDKYKILAVHRVSVDGTLKDVNAQHYLCDPGEEQPKLNAMDEHKGNINEQ